MTDTLRTARDDLAFMKELAEDRGPLPPIVGQHMLWVGLLYGLNLLYCYAGLAGFAPLPKDWYPWAWAPATVVYAPIITWLSIRGSRTHWGPSARLFAGAWTAVFAMSVTIIAVVAALSWRTGHDFWPVWPPIVMMLYGGAWMVIGAVGRRWWAIAAALACFAFAIAAGLLVGANEYWLVFSLALLLCLGLPGALILRAARRLP